MVNLEAVLQLINPHKNRVLLYAQSSLTEHQFKAFKKLFLDEMGKSGLESELGILVQRETRPTGKAWHGQE